MKARNRYRSATRAIISAQRLDQYLTRELHKVPGFHAVSVSAGYRLRAPDAEGCNWSGEVVPVHGVRAPPPEVIAATLRPIVRDARARFNLSE
jgi:hypothetical protein